jgi:carboxypeptidase Taq
VSGALEELRRRLAELYDLERTLSVLGWDQRTMMPPRGAEARAEATATLGGLVHERFTSDEIGRLLEELRPHEESLPYDSDDASLVRVATGRRRGACRPT